jgi:hypothetical protein
MKLLNLFLFMVFIQQITDDIILKQFTSEDLVETAKLWSQIWIERPVYKLVGITFEQFYPYCLKLCEGALKYDWNYIVIYQPKASVNKKKVVGFAFGGG